LQKYFSASAAIFDDSITLIFSPTTSAPITYRQTLFRFRLSLYMERQIFSPRGDRQPKIEIKN